MRTPLLQLTSTASGVAALFFGLLVTQTAAAASFSNAPPLITACGNQTATLLTDGKLLIAGGRGNAGPTISVAELYDPFSGTWVLTNSMSADRAEHTATLLPNGKVLVVGGYSSTNGALTGTELFDPITGIWTNAGSLNAARFFHTATLLPNGQVLVTGGTSNGTTAVSIAEIYDPWTGIWRVANPPNFARYSQTATLLPTGQVLIAGGIGTGGTLVPAAELYDPSTGIWTATNSLNTPRFSHTATLLPGGEVLIAGGATNGGAASSGAEFYNPATGTWIATGSLNTSRFDHSATLLPNGTVLVAGGTSNGVTALTNAEVYSPGTETWVMISGSLNSGRYSHTATLLPSEDVLVAGGFYTNQALSSVERYSPASGQWTSAGSMIEPQTVLTEVLLASGNVLVVDPGATTAEIYNLALRKWQATAGMSAYRNGFSCTLLPNGNVLAAGGYDSDGNNLATAELFVPTIGAWIGASSMNQAHAEQTATLLADGKVLIAGGVDALGNFSSSAELYDPATDTWAVTGSLNTARGYHIAMALPNGKVLVAGGENDTNSALTSSELYNVDSRSWTYTGKLNASRTLGYGASASTATLLPSGKVLATGGYDYQIVGHGTLSSAELYNPGAGNWTLTASLPQPRYGHTATLLPNGRVLVAGGNNGTSNLSSAIMYDAATGTWATTASLSGELAYHAATLLPNGNVFVMGGEGANYFPVAGSELYNPDSSINASWRPVISSVSLLNTNSGVAVTGSGFRGVSEGSSGTSKDSPADFPVTELRSLSTGQTLFVPSTNWSTNSIACVTANGLPPGYLLATIFVNGIPSQGQVFRIPTLAGVSNLPATAIHATTAVLNAEILDNGGNDTSILLYYGTTDGGTNAGAWSHSIPLGVESGVFEQTLSGLSSNTTYYFTVKAVNVVGTSWAAPSQSFTTLTTPIVTNLPVSGIQSLAATLNGQVLFTGNKTPAITIYYGPTDGGANAAAWSNSVALGLQSQTFSKTVTGLNQNTTYFYTSQAVNLAGTNWAVPSQSFTTLTITPPAVINLPATSIQGTFATLNGQVLSSGNQTPSVTLYYGPGNGGTNAGAWAQSTAVGFQNGAFAQTISGLSTNTTYFYAALAVNSSGAVWALPPQSFVTSPTNFVLPSAVLTQHYDDGRTGMNLKEFLLNTATVNPMSFGILYSRPVDDQLYAQPLIATNVNIPNSGSRNLLILCTVNDSVYAYDANDATVTVPYWTRTFIKAPTVVPPRNSDLSAIGACGGNYKDFSGNIGIVGTPVIDPISGTMYCIARTKESGNFVQKLHALDITSGADKTNSPVVISAVDQFGDVFDPLRQNQRAGLALANGVVYVSWTSHCDLTPYSGWVMGYDETTLQQLYVFNDCPGLNQAGIWMSGQAPAVDSSGNLYLSTGNGGFDGVQSFGESFLRLTPTAGELEISSYFTPYNWSDLNGADDDLGSAGVLLIPGTSLLLSGGKAGTLYLVNKDKMGGNSFSAAQETTNIVQSLNLGGEIHGGPVWWDGPNGSYAYIWAASGHRLQQFQMLSTAGKSNLVQIAQGTTVGGSGQPGGVLAVSANNSTPGSGIVWAAVNTSQDANQAVVNGTLHAYDAGLVSHELWNSSMNPGRDALGSLAKFVPPVVAGGKVYMATFSKRLDVYGLFPSAQNLNALALENQPLSILPAQILSMASDPYGFSLTLSSVSPTSTNGATVVLGANSIKYTPVTGFIGLDQFTYTVASSQGGSTSASVFLQVLSTNQPSSALLPLTLAPGGASINFSGISGQTYTIQRALTLGGPWISLTNVIIGPDGTGAFVDTNPLAPAAFYRTSFP